MPINSFTTLNTAPKTALDIWRGIKRMINNLKLTDTQIDKILKEAVIIIDRREQNCGQIIEYFDKKKIKYVRKSLEFCDYSIMLNKNEELGIPFDMSFEKNVAVELKHSGCSGLDELANNFTNGRTAFENEFIKAVSYGCRTYLVVSGGSWKKIDKQQYQSLMGNKAFYNSMLSFAWKYNIHIHFINEEDLGMHIYRILIVALKKLLE